MMERTLLILKPDAYQRQLIGTILTRIEHKGFKLVGMKMMKMTESIAKQHYAPHEGKHFFGDLISYITSGPCVVLTVEGTNAITVMRKMVGATRGFEAEPGTIRGDFSLSMRYNIIHASDSPESAEREINIFFSKEELMEDTIVIRSWIEGGE